MSRRQNIQLCYPFEEKRFNKWGNIAIIQPKYDGIRCRALFHQDRVELLSSEENSLNFAVPHLANLLWEHRLLFITNGIFELDGELYNHDLPFETISSITGRTVERHPYHELMHYYIFDHVCEQTPFYQRSLDLGSCVEQLDSKWIYSAPGMVVEEMKQIEYALKMYLAAGYEGLIARKVSSSYERKRSTGMMKWKPRKSDQYTIVDYTAEVDKHGQVKDRLGAFFVRDESNNIFKVGTGFNDQQRVAYWDQVDSLIGKECIIKYQHITEKGVPRFPVFDVLVE